MFHPKQTLSLKKRESNYISEHYAENKFDVEHFPDFSSYLEHRRNMYAYIRSQNFLKINYPVTHPKNCKEDWFGTKLMYKYTRQALNILNPLEALYALEGENEKQALCFMVNSGHAANMNSLLTLISCYEELTVDYSEKIFYETNELFSFYKDRLNKSLRQKMLFIDSSVSDFSYPSELHENTIYILDTTCIVKGDKELNHFIKKCLENKTKIILTRSHLKLDSLGCEYSLLGSVCVLNFQLFTKPNVGFLKSEFNFIGRLQKAIGNHGHFASIDQIYPFLMDKSFNSLLYERFMRLTHNYNSLARFMTEQNIEFTAYAHKQFFTFYVKKNYSTIEEYESRSAAYLTQIRKKSHYPIYYSDSFGFDYFGVSAFIDSNTEKKDLGIICRLALGDLDRTDFESSKELLANILVKLLN